MRLSFSFSGTIGRHESFKTLNPLSILICLAGQGRKESQNLPSNPLTNRKKPI